MNQDSDARVVEETPGPEIKIHRKIVRRVKEDGFFKTGVEVVEDEEVDFESTAQHAADLLRDGHLNAK